MKFWQNKTKATPTFPQKSPDQLPAIDKKYKDTQIETAAFALG